MSEAPSGCEGAKLDGGREVEGKDCQEVDVRTRDYLVGERPKARRKKSQHVVETVSAMRRRRRRHRSSVNLCANANEGARVPLPSSLRRVLCWPKKRGQRLRY